MRESLKKFVGGFIIFLPFLMCPGDTFPIPIKTLEDFIDTWRKRVATGQGSKEVLVFYDAAKKEPSIEAFEQCIKQAEEKGDQWGETVCLLDAYKTMYQAMHASSQTFELAEKWTSRGGELAKKLLGYEVGPYALSLNNLGILFKAQGNYEKAQPFYERALVIRERALGSEHPLVASSLNNLANLLTAQGKYEEARPLYERALAIREKSLGPEHLRVAQSLNNLAILLDMQGKYDEAQTLYERALAIREKALGSEHPLVADSLNNLAVLLDMQGEYDEAQPLYERALTIRENALGAEHSLVADSLNNLAALLADQGEYEKAQPLYERAQSICEKALGPEHPNVLQILNGLATLLADQGEYEKARRLHERALAIRENTLGDNHPDVAQSLNNLALLHADQGEYDEAQILYERALAIWEKALGVEHPDVAQALNNLAVMLADQGKYDEAQPLVERAYGIWEKALGAEHPDVAQALNNLAALLIDQGKYDEAQPLVERTRNIWKKVLGSEHPLVAASLDNLAILLEAQGEYDEALSLYERVLAIRKKALGSEHPLVANSLNNLAGFHWKKGDLTNARKHFLKAADTLHRHIRKIFFSLSFAEQQNLLELYIPVQISFLLSACRDRNSFEQVYSYIFRWKGLLIASLHHQTEISRLAEENSDLKQKVEQLQLLRRKIARLHHKERAISYTEWEARNSKLTASKEKLERELARAFPPGGARDPLEGMELSDFQEMFASDEVFLDIYRYRHREKGKFVEERYAAFVIGPRLDLALIDLGNAKNLDKSIELWRMEFSKVSWSNLMDNLWKPLKHALPTSTYRVVLSPDNQLARIPWHLFPLTTTESSKTGFSRKKLREGDILLTQTDTPRQFVRLRHNDTDPERSKRSILLVGGIDFGDCKKKQSNDCFDPLKGSKKEVNQLKEIVKKHGYTARVLMDNNATKDTVTSILPQVTVAHLSTHGFFYPQSKKKRVPKTFSSRNSLGSSWRTNSRNPLVASGIALAFANTMTAEGLLTAEELVGLDLRRLKLVTLSACNTGRGQEIAGQGVMGLRASIMAAGVRNILMSLWKVDDDATARLMKAFYLNLWEKELSPGEALREAQMQIANNPRFKAPYYWAAWVLVGEM